jgi:hypothetical protein
MAKWNIYTKDGWVEVDLNWKQTIPDILFGVILWGIIIGSIVWIYVKGV